MKFNFSEEDLMESVAKWSRFMIVPKPWPDPHLGHPEARGQNLRVEGDRGPKN